MDTVADCMTRGIDFFAHRVTFCNDEASTRGNFIKGKWDRSRADFFKGMSGSVTGTYGSREISAHRLERCSKKKKRLPSGVHKTYRMFHNGLLCRIRVQNIYTFDSKDPYHEYGAFESEVLVCNSPGSAASCDGPKQDLRKVSRPSGASVTAKVRDK